MPSDRTAMGRRLMHAFETLFVVMMSHAAVCTPLAALATPSTVFEARANAPAVGLATKSATPRAHPLHPPTTPPSMQPFTGLTKRPIIPLEIPPPSRFRPTNTLFAKLPRPSLLHPRPTTEDGKRAKGAVREGASTPKPVSTALLTASRPVETFVSVCIDVMTLSVCAIICDLK